jgi:hypothetical protein
MRAEILRELGYSVVVYHSPLRPRIAIFPCSISQFWILRSRK